MKRSEVNELLRQSKDFLKKNNFNLPPFAFWSVEDWKSKGEECFEIKTNKLGWDITDFGMGDFQKQGLILFTIRNGNYKDENEKKTYAEKVMIVGENQITPYHFHWKKMEDIICRAGGNLQLQLYASTEDEKLSKEPFEVSIDGVKREYQAGTIITLKPGESISLYPGLYHKFWGEPGKGTVLVGEVSQVNDDDSDNRFLKPVGRFPEIEEDEPVLHYLCFEYPLSIKPVI